LLPKLLYSNFWGLAQILERPQLWRRIREVLLANLLIDYSLFREFNFFLKSAIMCSFSSNTLH